MTDIKTDTPEQPHSVKISINAKLMMSGELKIYSATPDEAMRIAFEKAEELKTKIEQQNKRD